jgi:hypothetical protein
VLEIQHTIAKLFDAAMRGGPLNWATFAVAVYKDSDEPNARLIVEAEIDTVNEAPND